LVRLGWFAMMGKPGTEVVEVELRYGSDARRCHVPRCNLAEVLEPRGVDADAGGEAARLKEALDNPIGTPRLEEMVQPDDQVALVIDDMARPTPVRRILPAVLDRLSGAGVADGQIRVVIALGTHRPMTPVEIEARIGADIVRRVRVENHDFQDRSRLAYVGESSDGIPVWINRRVKEASFRIAVGNIVPHGVAGWAGGGKIIYPGVAGIDTVDGFHGAFGTDLRNRLGADDAPIREEIERLVSYVGLEFIVNTVLSGGGTIYRAVAGDCVLAHRQGVTHARQVYAVPSQVRADVALVSSYPADLDFWQAGKALYSGELLLRDGGTLILVTPCPEGVVQNHDLLGYMRFSPAELLSQLQAFQARDRAAAAAALRVGLVTQRVNVVVVSDGLGSADAAGLGFAHAADLQQAVDNALEAHGPDCKLSVLTHGGDIFPEHVRAQI
jgi:nickel-dependent lactate racemase